MALLVFVYLFLHGIKKGPDWSPMHSFSNPKSIIQGLGKHVITEGSTRREHTRSSRCTPPPHLKPSRTALTWETRSPEFIHNSLPRKTLRDTGSLWSGLKIFSLTPLEGRGVLLDAPIPPLKHPFTCLHPHWKVSFLSAGTLSVLLTLYPQNLPQSLELKGAQQICGWVCVLNL